MSRESTFDDEQNNWRGFDLFAPTPEHQIQRYLAETFAEWRAARTFVYDTARQIELASAGQRVDADATKLFAAPWANAPRTRRFRYSAETGTWENT